MGRCLVAPVPRDHGTPGRASRVEPGVGGDEGEGGERERGREREREKRIHARPGLHPQHKQRVEVG